MTGDQPNFKLERPEDPRLKITIEKIPVNIYKELKLRAKKYNIPLPKYCRIVLEHAYENKNEYSGQVNMNYSDDYSPDKIHVPVKNRKFKQDLRDWSPNGITKYTGITKLILMKHIEVRSW